MGISIPAFASFISSAVYKQVKNLAHSRVQLYRATEDYGGGVESSRFPSDNCSLPTSLCMRIHGDPLEWIAGWP